VTLPPGWARLATPVLDRIRSPCHDDGNCVRGVLGRLSHPPVRHHHDINLEANQLLCQTGDTIPLTRCPPVFDGDILAVDPTEIAQALLEGLGSDGRACPGA